MAPQLPDPKPIPKAQEELMKLAAAGREAQSAEERERAAIWDKHRALWVWHAIRSPWRWAVGALFRTDSPAARRGP